MKKQALKKRFLIPKGVENVAKTLKNAGFEAYFVGGCVRDLFLNRKPKDWDITTNAIPEEIIKLFIKTFYENNFGTVGVVDETAEDETLKVIEVTPYRLESGYSDFRHPDSVKFSKKIEDDLNRRDFTINSIAINSKGQIIDLFGGQDDIKNRTIKTVGDPEKRFTEDALRILRAVRFSAELGFTINIDTQKAIEKHANLLGKISKERIRDEFQKIIMSENPMVAMVMCQKMSILSHISPIFDKMIGVSQNQAHSYDVWEHSLRTLQHSADKNMPLDVRLAALFHDIGKPETKRHSEKKNEPTFYGHDVVGARITKKVLEDLKFPKKIIEKVVKLVRWHMFFSDTEQITLSAVRRMVANVGKENIWDLMDVRTCDRIGTGRPKENPYRLRKYRAMIEEAMRDPISVQMLKIDGKKLMEITKANPGPKIGFILHALLEEVLENPKNNDEKWLENRALELNKLSEKRLKKLGEKGKEKKEEFDEKEVSEIRKKHWVK
ncbi:HD domain-containing protein [Candidatus Nomurabacteria bacterium]|nr:HD domain-containing protein [Candidatus Nomurabacteria bacterium]